MTHVEIQTCFLIVADFVNFQSLALYDEMLGYIMAFVVFVSTVKSIRLLRFNK